MVVTPKPNDEQLFAQSSVSEMTEQHGVHFFYLSNPVSNANTIFQCTCSADCSPLLLLILSLYLPHCAESNWELGRNRWGAGSHLLLS